MHALVGLQGSEVQPCAMQRQALAGWRRASDLLDPDDMLASCPASLEDGDGVASLRPLSFREPCAATPSGCRVRLARAYTLTPFTLPDNASRFGIKPGQLHSSDWTTDALGQYSHSTSCQCAGLFAT